MVLATAISSNAVAVSAVITPLSSSTMAKMIMISVNLPHRLRPTR